MKRFLSADKDENWNKALFVMEYSALFYGVKHYIL